MWKGTEPASAEEEKYLDGVVCMISATNYVQYGSVGMNYTVQKGL